MIRRLELTMLPAREGDCLLLTYEGEGRKHRILVDGGRKATAPVVRAALQALHLPREEQEFEALVVTHVDRDHIEGVLSLLEDGCPVSFRDAWFNGLHHLYGDTVERYGAVQGERLSEWLQVPGRPWNETFSRGPVEVGGPTVTLDGGCNVTILSPDRAQLEALIPHWKQEVAAANMVKGKKPPWSRYRPGTNDLAFWTSRALAGSTFEPDRKKANGSTIAVLLSSTVDRPPRDSRPWRILLAATPTWAGWSERSSRWPKPTVGACAWMRARCRTTEAWATRPTSCSH